MNKEFVDQIKGMVSSVEGKNIIYEACENKNSRIRKLNYSIKDLFADLNKMCGEVNNSGLTRSEVEIENVGYGGGNSKYCLTANHNGFGFIRIIQPGESGGYGTTQSSGIQFDQFITRVLTKPEMMIKLKAENRLRKGFLNYLISLESIKNELIVLNDYCKMLDEYDKQITEVKCKSKFFYLDAEGKPNSANKLELQWSYQNLLFDVSPDNASRRYNGTRNSLSMNTITGVLTSAVYRDELTPVLEMEKQKLEEEEEQCNKLIKDVKANFNLYYLAKSLANGGN